MMINTVKKVVIGVAVVLFFTQVGMAENVYPRKPKGEKEGKLTGGEKINFMMLQQAEDGIEELNAYELTPPKKTVARPAVKSKEPQLEEVQAVQEKVEQQVPVKEKVIRKCPKCSATGHDDEARFCKYCGAKLGDK